MIYHAVFWYNSSIDINYVETIYIIMANMEFTGAQWTLIKDISW